MTIDLRQGQSDGPGKAAPRIKSIRWTPFDKSSLLMKIGDLECDNSDHPLLLPRITCFLLSTPDAFVYLFNDSIEGSII
jgi:hypothetical protein